MFYLLVPKIDILLDKNPQKPPLGNFIVSGPKYVSIDSLYASVGFWPWFFYLINRDSLFTLYFSTHLRLRKTYVPS